METRIGGQSRQLYGKKSVDWDLNDWGWDGNLFLATPLNAAAPSDCKSKQPFLASNTSSSCSEGAGSLEAEKRRRVMVEEGGGPCDEAGSLTLKLGSQVYPVAEEDVANWEGKNGKRAKPHGGGSSRLACQVEGCGADFSCAKDYHRRHKVCEMHAKASKAVVGNVMQRFCQQCSRFHLLQEFDEGKRSCRRRLAGHNRRRRKTHPEAVVTGNNVTNDQASSYLLITLLRILSNSHSTGLDQSKDQDLLPHLVKSIASLASSPDANILAGLLQASQEMCKLGSAAGTSSEPANPSFSNGVAAEESFRPSCIPSTMTCITGKQGAPRPVDYSFSAAATRADMSSKRSVTEVTTRAIPSQVPATLTSAANVIPTRSEALCSLQHIHAEPTVERVKLKGFDLNNTYNDAHDYVEVCEPVIHGVKNVGSNCLPWILQDSHHSSPPQTSGNSDSVSTQSLSNSNGEAQNRTGRIVFKLFGKDPNDFPLSLRSQVLDWLSHSPTDMESYIRPGCIILTVYLRLPESAWKELCHDLSSSMNKLLSAHDDAFWRTGWLYAKVQDRIAFIYNGRAVLESPLLLKSPDHCNILSITPIAVSVSATVKFTVKGFCVARSTARLLCAFEGTHLVPETTPPFIEDTNTTLQHEGLQCCSFSCSVPNVVGRGFIEVEENGLSGDFFPFIVAEEDVCSEIRMLENIIDAAPNDGIVEGKSDIVCARNLAIDFLHEMGWLLHRSYLRSRSEKMKPQPNAFPLTRFKWLMSFAMDRQWCAVVKKLLDILFQENIDSGECTPAELAVSENLLHIAVRKNCKPMVELLLRYKPETALEDTRADCFLFKPDMLSSSKITPLHIAASIVGAEGLLDALTDDPKQLGTKAWNSVRDSTGFTPEDYARSRGLISYMDLVQKKINRRLDKGHVVVDIPLLSMSLGAPNKQHDGPNPAKLNTFQIDKSKLMQQSSCRACNHQLLHRRPASRSMLYRPLMLSMVGIAAVCVCVGLLLKGPPEVLFIERPFRWETLSYGSS